MISVPVLLDESTQSLLKKLQNYTKRENEKTNQMKPISLEFEHYQFLKLDIEIPTFRQQSVYASLAYENKKREENI